MDGKLFFNEIPPAVSDSSPAVISGDFDGDGDIDYIIIQTESIDSWSNTKTRSRYLENDGKGNFKLRQYEKKK